MKILHLNFSRQLYVWIYTKQILLHLSTILLWFFGIISNKFCIFIGQNIWQGMEVINRRAMYASKLEKIKENILMERSMNKCMRYAINPSPHASQVTHEAVFSCDCISAGKVVETLPWSNIVVLWTPKALGSPPEIPFSVIFALGFVVFGPSAL